MGVAQVILSFRLSPINRRSGLQGDELAAGSRDGGQTHHPITVFLDDRGRQAEVAQAICSLGYEMVPEASRAEEGGAPQSGNQDESKRPAGDGRISESQPSGRRTDPHVHDQAGWWESSQGKLVIVIGSLIVGAIAYSRLLPFGSQFLFVVAGAIGTVPLVGRALPAICRGLMMPVEAVAATAILGAMAVGVLGQAAVVTFLVALTVMIGDHAAQRLRKVASLAVFGGNSEPVDEFLRGPSRTVGNEDKVVTSSTRCLPIDGEGAARPLSIDDPEATKAALKSPSIDSEAVQSSEADKPIDGNQIIRVTGVAERPGDAKGAMERFVDKLALSWMCLCSVAASGIALVPPLAFDEPWSTSIYAALVILLIGCPFAIRISAAVPVASAIGGAPGRGIFVKDGAVLEAIGKLRNIAFEKREALTEGTPRVTDVVVTSSLDSRELLRLAATAEQGSGHPIAVAIISHAKDRDIPLGSASNFEEIPGGGVLAAVDGRQIKIGPPARVGIFGSATFSTCSRLERDGKTVSVVEVDRKAAGLIAVYDELRPGVENGIIALKKLGMRPIVFTGESPVSTEVLGARLGIAVKGGLLPGDKSNFLEAMAREEGLINLTRGLDSSSERSTAALRISMGARAGTAIAGLDAAVVGDRIADVIPLIRLGRQASAVIRQNLIASVVLKAVVVVLTVAWLADLWVPALIEGGATLLVTANGLRLLGRPV
ncbi:MAG: HAD-IC family P-type ATPase [Pseudomonadota bacterium]